MKAAHSQTWRLLVTSFELLKFQLFEAILPFQANTVNDILIHAKALIVTTGGNVQPREISKTMRNASTATVTGMDFIVKRNMTFVNMQSVPILPNALIGRTERCVCVMVERVGCIF